MAAVDPPSEGDPDLIGATLKGGYRITRHVAEGGMGHVYEATAATGERVAIKVLHTALMGKPEVSFRFRREGEIVESIKSAHIPRLLARGRDAKSRPFMVLEFAEGTVLSSLIYESTRIPLLPALEISIQICRALVAAHAAGVVHRDIKPENVIVGGDLSAPRVKVLDFSVSKSEDLQFTKTGTIIGTPSYMPPEQARGDEASPLVDVYAVGAILYDMLCGRPPFDGDEPGKVLADLLTSEPPKPRSLAPLIPESVETVIMRAIARDPKNRYPIVEALLEALESQQRDVAARGSSPTLAPPEPSNPGEDHAPGPAPVAAPAWLASTVDGSLPQAAPLRNQWSVGLIVALAIALIMVCVVVALLAT